MTIQTFPLSGPINLQCRFGFGSLTVRAEDGISEASVQLTARDPRSTILDDTTVAMRGPTLAVAGPRPNGGLLDLPLFGRKQSERDAVDIEVIVPSGTAMKVASFAADVTVHGRVGGSDIASGASSSELAHVDGDLRLRAGTGPIHIGQVSGSTVVRSGSSDVRIGDARGPVEVAFGNGSLEVGVARGPVKLRCGSGDATISEAHGDLDLTSGSGAFTIGLQPGQQARLDVVTAHGQLRTEMPVAEEPTPSGVSLSIRARSGSGDVIIRRTDRTATR
ncbi:MAG: hypothetical protein QOH56_2609 [Pseudonocardiales bacterium]|jgi:hypothetical protein|nr:hypothetical protein [Pseudonocardiales bacterium]